MDQFMWGFVAGVATFCFCGIVVGLASERKEKKKAERDRLHERLDVMQQNFAALDSHVWGINGLTSRVYDLELKVETPQRRAGDKKGKSCACR